jgi:hypothetical protein
VEPNELERLIGELEIAVDRLRSLYEQYFMGIERLEPTVPRKDCDRRVQLLRKEQIRNTALRFRFQMLVQRYNTYQTHWQRICRDIENGTYKRHVVRAQKRFGIRRQSDHPPASTTAPPERSFADELAELDKEFAPAAALDDLDVAWDDEPATAALPRNGQHPPAFTRLPAPPTPSTRPPRPPPSRPAPRTPRTGPPSSRPGPKTPRVPAAEAKAAPAAPKGPAPMPPPSRPDVAPASAKAPPSRQVVAKPQPSKPAPPPPSRPGPPPPPSKPGPVTSRREAELPDDRVRQLYSQYVETRRRQNESTATITYDSVARNLRESSAKLQQKLGRNVDFEVVVKDGRTILRPVVK